MFSSHGNNFVKTMLRLGREHEELAVVADQIGRPTSARGIASVLWGLTERYLQQGELPWGLYHFSGQPACSWHEFAVEIFRHAAHLNLLQNAPRARQITTAEYSTPARRPLRAVLDCSKLVGFHSTPPSEWKQELSRILREILKKTS